MSSKTVGGALLSVLLVAFVGCDNSGPGDASPESTVETSAGTPAAEGNGAEEPVPNGGGKPAIETVGLPIGGDVEYPFEPEQCVTLSWLGAALPAGVSVTVTSVNFDAGAKAGACNGIPSCEGYTFTSAGGTCSVGLTVEPGADAAPLSASGQVACTLPAEQCQAFRANPANAAQDIGIYGPDPTPSPNPSSPSPSVPITPSITPETTPPIVTDEPSPEE